jgi:hypothetical protein
MIVGDVRISIDPSVYEIRGTFRIATMILEMLVIFPWIFLTGSRRRNGFTNKLHRCCPSTVHCLNSSCPLYK